MSGLNMATSAVTAGRGYSYVYVPFMMYVVAVYFVISFILNSERRLLARPSSVSVLSIG